MCGNHLSCRAIGVLFAVNGPSASINSRRNRVSLLRKNWDRFNQLEDIIKENKNDQMRTIVVMVTSSLAGTSLKNVSRCSIFSSMVVPAL